MRHEDLEKHDGVPSGKYTVGLGQQGLAFCGDREDPVSMALTACKRLLEKHNVSPMEVGAARGTTSGLCLARCGRLLLFVPLFVPLLRSAAVSKYLGWAPYHWRAASCVRPTGSRHICSAGGAAGGGH